MAHEGITAVASEREPLVKMAGLTVVLLGLLVFAAAWMAVNTLVFWSTLIVGVLVLVSGALNAWGAHLHEAGRIVVPASLNVVLGAWLFASAFLLPVERLGLFWANLLFGLLIVIFAGYSAWAGLRDRRQTAGAA